MSEKISYKKLGLVFGIFLAIVHALWALSVAIIPDILQRFINWVFELHFISPIYVLTPFSIGNAVMLVGLTFVTGNLFGWVFGMVWNQLKK